MTRLMIICILASKRHNNEIVEFLTKKYFVIEKTLKPNTKYSFYLFIIKNNTDHH